MSYGSFPPEFDVDLYLRSNPDLAGFPAEEARLHFERYGENEGRIASGISSRESFLALVPRDRLALEIGPFNSPCLRGKNVRYFDVMDSAALRDRAKLHGLGQSGVPETIHYISPTADLTSVGDKFSSVLSGVINDPEIKAVVVEPEADFGSIAPLTAAGWRQDTLTNPHSGLNLLVFTRPGSS